MSQPSKFDCPVCGSPMELIAEGAWRCASEQTCRFRTYTEDELELAAATRNFAIANELVSQYTKTRRLRGLVRELAGSLRTFATGDIDLGVAVELRALLARAEAELEGETK